MKIRLLAAFYALSGCYGLSAQAESIHPQLDAKHVIVLGAYRQSADGEFYATPNDLDKKSIKFKDLDVDNTDTSVMAEYRYRLNDKWLFSVGTYQFASGGTIQTKRDFEYNGVEFQAGAKLDTNLDIDTYMLEAMYSVYKTDRAEILLGGGLHMFDFSADLEAQLQVGDQEREKSQASDDILAPLPNLRLQGFYALSPKWGLAMTAGWLSAKYEDYDGAFVYVHARTTYRFTERFGAGVGYQFVDVDLEVDQARGKAGFEVRFDGPAVYFTYSL